MVNRSIHTCTHAHGAAAKQLTLSRDSSHLQLELLQLQLHGYHGSVQGASTYCHQEAFEDVVELEDFR